MDRSTEFRAALSAERARILSGRESGLEVLATPESLPVDDQATLLHEQFVAIRQRAMDDRKLKLIAAALQRVDRGTFGECEECGEGISVKRLNSIPWAAYCVSCQDRLDRETSTDDTELRPARGADYFN